MSAGSTSGRYVVIASRPAAACSSKEAGHMEGRLWPVDEWRGGDGVWLLGAKSIGGSSFWSSLSLPRLVDLCSNPYDIVSMVRSVAVPE